MATATVGNVAQKFSVTPTFAVRWTSLTEKGTLAAKFSTHSTVPSVEAPHPASRRAA